MNALRRDTSGAEHDYRCMGECVHCRGADACSMVGMTCIPCGGQCADRKQAITEPMIDAAADALGKKLHWINDRERAVDLALTALNAAMGSR